MGTDPQIQKVKDATDIVSLIGERVTLKSGGRSLKGLCPFHSEKSPSFYVTPEMQIYKCFGCGESGDVFTFLQKYEGMSFAEALEYLAQKAGITLESGYKTSQDQLRDKLLGLLELASQYYHFILTNHDIGLEARDYLHTRQIHSQAQKDFFLGYAPNSWRAMTQYLTQKKSYHISDLEAVGLVVKSQRSTNHYDRFRGRLIFPLKDAHGQVVGFSGRVLDPTVKQAKYINSPETALYHKAKLLYGYTQARAAIRKKDRVVIVEGEMDVISSHQAGIKEVVAVKGSALTADQITILKRMTKNIILSLDADAAGQEAIKRAISLCEQHELNLRVLELEGGKDPDELIKTDPKLWQQTINDSKSVYQFYLDNALSSHDSQTGEGQKAIMQFLTPIYAQIQNAVEQTYYINKLAEVLHTSQAAIVSELNRYKRDPQKAITNLSQPSSPPTTTSASYSRQERLERYLLSLLLQLETQAIKRLEQVNPDHFTHAYLQNLIITLKQLAKDQTVTNLRQLVLRLPIEKQPLINQLYTQEQSLLELSQSELNKYFLQALSELEQLHLKKQLLDLSKAMSQPDLDPSMRKELQARYQILTQKLSQAPNSI